MLIARINPVATGHLGRNTCKVSPLTNASPKATPARHEARFPPRPSVWPCSLACSLPRPRPSSSSLPSSTCKGPSWKRRTVSAPGNAKKFFDKRQQELDAKQNELQKQREEIEKQSKVLSQQALAKRMEDWQKQMIELQTVFVEYNKELQKKQGELTQPIYGKMVALMRRMATQDGYDAILEKQAVPVYARRSRSDRSGHPDVQRWRSRCPRCQRRGRGSGA